MLVTTNPQQTLWETILPPGYQDLPAELGAVDASREAERSSPVRSFGGYTSGAGRSGSVSAVTGVLLDPSRPTR